MIRRLLPTVAALAAWAAPAHASSTQESIFMDDPKIVYSAPDKLEGTLAEMKRLGADRIRVSVFWKLLAPEPNSTTRPFAPGAGADPRSYSAEKWDRYDRIVTTAKKLGLKLLFTVTAPAPYWATGDPPRPDIDDTFRPSPSEFKDFVKALGTRYSGTFLDEAVRTSGFSLLGPCEPVPTIPLPPSVCPPDGQDPTPENPNPPNTGPVLPRVGTWSIWNEPNMPGWLTPQSSTNPDNQDDLFPESPHVYRALADAMYSGLQETNHGSDKILLVETAPRGARERSVTQSIAPLEFIREVYCLDRDFNRYSGRAAEIRSCPSDAEGFAGAHPILFNASGFAHHPYAFLTAPSVSDDVADHAVLADLGRLTTTLDRAFRQYGSSRRIPIWLTEYGYQTNPPDPYSGMSWKHQAGYLAEAEWLAFKRPRVRSTTQFLLYDDRPLRQYPDNDPRHWGSFQTGLRAADGKRKKAYGGYQRTIHVIRRGRRVTVFGLYRPARAKTGAQIQFKRAGSKAWKGVRSLQTNGAGFLRVKLKQRRHGAFRIAFDAGGKQLFTRSVSR